MAVSRKVALVNIQIEAHTTEATKIHLPHESKPISWARAKDMGRCLQHGARDPGPGPKKSAGPGPLAKNILGLNQVLVGAPDDSKGRSAYFSAADLMGPFSEPHDPYSVFHYGG